MKTQFCALLLTLGASALVQAETYQCTNGGMERTISVVYQTPGQPVPCEVHYTKDGNVQTLWRADNEAGYCENQAQAFADKQSGWGWACSLVGGESPAAGEQLADDVLPAEGADGQ